jgi:site-specific DNA-methyltransferase (adenine-specific)
MTMIIHGDALQVLPEFEPGTFDAVITDPPYSSGGDARTILQSTGTKYQQTGTKTMFANFEGDQKDARSWRSWAHEWMSLARAASKPGAPICVFTDWRQLPNLTDVLQWAGWTWRGVVVWDKKNARPQKGRFRAQAEYIVWGSNGDMPLTRDVPPMMGVFSHAMPALVHRLHQTEKPVQLMRELVKICEPGGKILDPFAGAGTTIEAARLEGYECVGIEMSEAYWQIAHERLKEKTTAPGAVVSLV